VSATSNVTNRGVSWRFWGAAAASVLVAAALYSRFSINQLMSRDEGIYTYGGQQLAHGVPPYQSIFDPKAPLSTIIAGVCAFVARLLGRNDIYAIRAGFFVCALLTVLALFLLVTRLFGSVLGGLTAAVVFAWNWPFAVDALGGPDAKTPAVLFAVVSMWLLAGRRWFWAGFAAALAVLVWQPMVGYALVAVLFPLVADRGRRLRAAGAALLGGAVPAVLTAGYFAVVGAFGDFIQSAVVFPISGVKRSPETMAHRLGKVVDVVNTYYGMGGVLFWVGLALLAVLVVVHLVTNRSTPYDAWTSPLVLVVPVTFVFVAAYTATDFQSWPDLYPFLPYPAIGIGGAVALVTTWAAARMSAWVPTVVVLVAIVLVSAVTWVTFTDTPTNNRELPLQLSSACALDRLTPSGRLLLSLGDPVPLVTTHRRNPDRFIYLGSGVDQWKVQHTPGGFTGWQAQIRRWRPPVIVLQAWGGRYKLLMVQWLKQSGYVSRYVGRTHVLVGRTMVATANQRGVKLTKHPRKFAHAPGGRRLPARDCA
jgi:hypothetical protein